MIVKLLRIPFNLVVRKRKYCLKVSVCCSLNTALIVKNESYENKSNAISFGSA